MAECVQYGKELVKIGTMESLYYVSYDKFLRYENEIRRLSGEERSSVYLTLDYGFRFRFPFPDEDRLKFGKIVEPYNRTVDVMLDQEVASKLLGESEMQGKYKIGVAMQRPVLRQSDGVFCLALVIKDHLTGILHRLEDDRGVKMVVQQIVKHHILPENDLEKKLFFRLLASRIVKGYRIKPGTVQYLKLENQGNATSLLPADQTRIRLDIQNNELAQRTPEKDKIVDKIERKLLRRERKKGKGPGS